MLKLRAEKATTYITTAKAASSKKSGIFGEQKANLTYEQRQARRKEIDERKKKTKCHNCGQIGHWVESVSTTKMTPPRRTKTLLAKIRAITCTKLL